MASTDSDSDSDSAPSSPDIEDGPFAPVPVSSSLRERKRKRGAPTAAASLHTTTTTTVIGGRRTRNSPWRRIGIDVGGVKEEEGEGTETEGRTNKKKKKMTKSTTKEARWRDTAGGTGSVRSPANWEEVYRLTQEMRKRVLAPVDVMGCEELAQDGLSDRDRRYQTLTALMLSSQTRDAITALAMRRLQTELPSPGLTLENVLAVDPAALDKMINAVGFHNNKTKYIKAAAVILRDRFDGDIPDSIPGLISLPGVGPKMAYLCMSSAWGRDEGIGVDVHVHRITNLWGWHKTRTPEQTRAALESWLPKEKWHGINRLLVGFGQTICRPVGRKCGECALAEHGLCPSAVVARKLTTRKVKTEEKEVVVVAKEETIVAEDLV